MYIKRLVLSAAALLQSLYLLSQNIQGQVTDTTQKPLAGVHIQVLNSLHSAVSDSNGRFFLTLPAGAYVIKTTVLGHYPRTDTLLVKNTALQLLFKPELTPSFYEVKEIIITANKTEETDIQSAVALTTLSAQKITDTRTWELNNLVALVPNLQYASLGVSYQQQIAIRGISVFSETPSTATYIDGVNALDIASNGLQLMDIERIEILRGPQGTLYGRNAMGGVINIITRQPNNITSAFSETSMGNQGLQRYGFGIKTPLIKNKLFTGISGQYQKQNGYYINDLSDKTDFLGNPMAGTSADGVRMGDEESYYGNFYLKYQHSQKLRLILNSKIQYDRSLGASAYYQAAADNITAIEEPYKLAVNSLGSNRRLVSNSSLALIYDHPAFRFFSTSAFQYVQQAYQGIDQDLYPYDMATGASYRNKPGEAYPQSVISQEFRFSSPATQSNIRWTAGSYFFYQDYDKRYAAIYENLALFFGIQPGTEVFKTDQKNTGAAAFGNVDYILRRKWTFTIGLRADLEDRSTDVERYYLNDDGSRVYSADTALHSRFFALSPKAAIRYAFSEQHQLYLSYSRGFRAGGNNMFTKGKYAGYQPEYSDNIELGHKYQTRDQKLRIASCLFFLSWQNMQLDMQPEPGVWIIDNIGKAYSYGLETELEVRPLKGMSIDIALGMNEARYGNFSFLGENIKGNRTILAPVYTLMSGMQQVLPLGRKMQFTIRAEYRSIGKQYFDLVNTIEQPAYHILNARTGINSKHISFFIWVQNITGARYLTYAMPGYFKQAIINRPRSFGATLTFKI